MYKPLLKYALMTAAPRFGTAVISARARAHAHNLFKDWGLYDLNQRLLAQVGCHVLSGPFEGLILTPLTHKEHIGPFLLGTYEMELHPWWAEVFREKFDVVIDVGASFGYYAIGLARKYPNIRTFAFDTDWWARGAMREMRRANRADNLAIRGYCTPRRLESRLVGNALVICDCEGYERQLLCEVAISALAKATMIIELHESRAPGVTEVILSRFEATHLAGTVQSRSSTPTVSLALEGFTPHEICRLSQEVRPPQQWLLLTPRAA